MMSACAAKSKDQQELKNKLTLLGDFSKLATYFVPIISGIYLFVALYKISKNLRSNHQIQVNIKAMALHATSFGAFMASCLIYIYVFASYKFGETDEKVYHRVSGLTYIFSSLS
jgi:uncharacterized membrane protein